MSSASAAPWQFFQRRPEPHSQGRRGFGLRDPSAAWVAPAASEPALPAECLTVLEILVGTPIRYATYSGGPVSGAWGVSALGSLSSAATLVR